MRSRVYTDCSGGCGCMIPLPEKGSEAWLCSRCEMRPIRVDAKGRVFCTVCLGRRGRKPRKSEHACMCVLPEKRPWRL